MKTKFTSGQIAYLAAHAFLILAVLVMFAFAPRRTTAPLGPESLRKVHNPLVHLQEINADNWDSTIQHVVPERSLILFLCFENDCRGELDDKQELFAQNKTKVLLGYVKLGGRLDGFLLNLFGGQPLTDGHMLVLSPQENTFYPVAGRVSPDVFSMFVECVRNANCQSAIKERNSAGKPEPDQQHERN